MRMRCVLAPPGCIMVRTADNGRTLTFGDVVEFNHQMPGVTMTWAEALAGHESAFEPEDNAQMPVDPVQE